MTTDRPTGLMSEGELLGLRRAAAEGLLIHARAGVVVKPVPVVCFKAEFTRAMYDYGNQFAWDPEVFLSLSYQWQLIRK